MRDILNKLQKKETNAVANDIFFRPLLFYIFNFPTECNVFELCVSWSRKGENQKERKNKKENRS